MARHWRALAARCATAANTGKHQPAVALADASLVSSAEPGRFLQMLGRMKNPRAQEGAGQVGRCRRSRLATGSETAIRAAPRG